MLKFAVKVDSEPALRAFREIRRDLKKDVRDVLLEVGKEYALPVAKAEAPSMLRQQIAVRATTSDAYLTATGNGWKRGRFWYLNNGGSIRKPFIARSGPIPIMEPGSNQVVAFRMSVKRPRHFRGKRFLEHAAEKARPIIRLELERRIPERMQAILDKHDVFRDTSIL